MNLKAAGGQVFHSRAATGLAKRLYTDGLMARVISAPHFCGLCLV